MTASSSPPEPEARPVAERAPRLTISPIQVIATALAAVTATIVASFLGVAGTVVGAGVASTLSVVGTAVYSNSLRRTQERVRTVVPVRRLSEVSYRPHPRRGTRSRPRNAPPAAPVGSPAAQGGPAQADPTRADPTWAEPTRADPTWAEPTYYPVALPEAAAPRRSLGVRIALGSAALFAAVLAVVTGVEMAASRPISDLVRGEAGSGTTLFGATHSSSSPRPMHPAGPSARPASRQKSAGGGAASTATAPTPSRPVPTVTSSAPATQPASSPAATPTTPAPSAVSSAPADSPSAAATSGAGAATAQP